jgi:putative transcription antitermination factor YqgF
MHELNYLSIDYGRTRIGLATANSVAKIARPLSIITNDENAIIMLMSEVADVDVVVVGTPRNMNGEYGEMYHEVKAWYENLHEASKALGHPADFVLFDETLSSVRAKQAAKELGRTDISHIDDIAAAIILQDYLESLN